MPCAVPDRKVVIGGVSIDVLDAAGWVAAMRRDIAAKKMHGGRPKIITAANGQVISLCKTDSAFARAMASVDMTAADGMSVVFASRVLTKAPLPERVATTDWFHHAANAAAEDGARFYLLGSTQENLQKALANLAEKHPGLAIVGAQHGYFSDLQLEDVGAEIRRSDPDVIWVALGNPRQLYIAQKLAALVPGTTWIHTCGGLFDHLAQVRPRAPIILQKFGLEWLFRVALEPRRLFWRYLTTNIQSIILMVRFSRTLNHNEDCAPNGIDNKPGDR